MNGDKGTNGQRVNEPTVSELEKQTDKRRDGPMGESAIHGTNTNNNNNISTQMHACVCGSLSLSPLSSSVCDLVIRVAGHPVTQGSKRGFAVGGHVRLVESGGDKHKLWRHAVNDEARKGWVEAPLAGAVALLLVFDIQPPKSLTKARRAAGPIGAHSGDIDKLSRAVLDALTGVVYLDDSQVRTLVVEKQWAGPAGPGVTITITPRSAP